MMHKIYCHHDYYFVLLLLSLRLPLYLFIILLYEFSLSARLRSSLLIHCLALLID